MCNLNAENRTILHLRLRFPAVVAENATTTIKQEDFSFLNFLYIVGHREFW